MSDDEKVKVDAIIIGGGPAGLACAIAMAKEELEVIVVERGEFCGAKNMGGLLYGTALQKLLPNFWEKAPFERPVSKRSFTYLGETDHLSASFGNDDWSSPPYNNTYIVHRSQFDKWLATEAEEAGASLLEGMVVDDLIYEGTGSQKKAIGVKIRGDEEFFADVIVIAEGSNALLTEKAQKELGLRGSQSEQEFGVGVKEIIGLPKDKIEDRFGLGENEGMALDYFGTPFRGIIGGGFIYTAKEAIHVGIVARSDTLAKSKLNPNDVLDKFKKHPRIRPLLKGGELLEYSAHLVPETGLGGVPELAGNGLLIAGDSAGLVNMSLYKEGTNLAMESGIMAAKATAAAKAKGDFSKATLSQYETLLKESTVVKDLKKYKGVPAVFENCPNVFALYPMKITKLVTDFFTVSEKSKKQIQKMAIKGFMRGLPKIKFVYDIIQAKKLC